MYPYFQTAFLASEAAVDIDNYINGRSEELKSVRELTNVLKQYQLKDIRDFELMPLWKAMVKNSDKEIRYYPELALELKLVTSELENISDNPNPKTLSETVIPFLCDYSRELINADREINPRRMMA